MTESARYLRAVEIHHRVVDLYRAVQRNANRFRARDRATLVPEGIGAFDSYPAIDRDRVVCALALKAATTKDAIFQLCELDLGDDAYCLSRVLLENAISLAWMLHDDRPRRIDTYTMFFAAVRERWRELGRLYYPDNAEIQAAVNDADHFDRAVSEEVFDGKYHRTWARFDGKEVSLAQMMASLVSEGTISDGAKPFAYAGAYFDGSAWIHSNAWSLAAFTERIQRTDRYLLEPVRATRQRTTALNVSNISMVLLLRALDDFLNLGIDEQLKDLIKSLSDDAEVGSGQSDAEGGGGV